MQFIVCANTALERTRVADHGNVWKETTQQHVKQSHKKLLESVKTGHLRWWSVTQIAPHINT